MSDIKLFRINNREVYEIKPHGFNVERSLQNLIEENLEDFLGIKFLESEYRLGADPSGRIDTLGIDENNSPVIVEYKRSENDNVINQGLFYLDYILDRKPEFQLLVMRKLGQATSENIEWDNSRLICIAQDFNRYDEHAIRQMSHNIELYRYRYYADESLLMLELVNTVEGEIIKRTNTQRDYHERTIEEKFVASSEKIKILYESLKTYISSLGDDIQQKTLKFYFAFKRISNFCCIEIHPHENKIVVFAKLNPSDITLEKNFTRDVSKIGHYGTGNLEITIRSESDFEKSKPLIKQSYEIN